MFITRDTFYSSYYESETLRIHGRQVEGVSTLGDRKAERFVAGETEDGKPILEWWLWVLTPMGWLGNPFHIISGKDQNTSGHPVTDAEAEAFVESGAMPASIAKLRRS